MTPRQSDDQLGAPQSAFQAALFCVVRQTVPAAGAMTLAATALQAQQLVLGSLVRHRAKTPSRQRSLTELQQQTDRPPSLDLVSGASSSPNVEHLI
ncbi:hypothetical protein FGO68_gene2175 [Halteria grandinella]|uniref:Uncharacterized protein n=1 Tax=Halteria grandinella TaxID=5974 RepID=A0A8J8NAC5_HALGN|nr:hypothetical protein FGO68_gene2175 [Halteria grandinella]